MDIFLSDNAILVYEILLGMILLFFLIQTGKKIKEIKSRQEELEEQKKMAALKRELR